MTWPTLLIAVAAGSAGFLTHNWSPARIFMGDSGSLFLGYVLATSGVLTCAAGSGADQAPLTAAACALLLTLRDGGGYLHGPRVTVAGRRRWTQGGADHLAHRLQIAGLSTPRVALVLSATAASWPVLGVIVISGIVPAAGALAATAASGRPGRAGPTGQGLGPDPQPGTIPAPVSSGPIRQ